MSELTEIADGLGFPEGPVWFEDGSVVLVEIQAARVTRVSPEGEKEVICEPGGAPNGAALGPDGKLYVANNGGSFTWVDLFGLTAPGPFDPSGYSGGRIERVDLDSGEVEVLYDSCDGRPLRSPNDLVFDSHGGFWFTDHGIREERTSDRTGVLYAKADGSEVKEAVFPLDAPNGVGLSPEGDRLYVAETYSGRLWAWKVTAPGEVEAEPGILPHGGQLVCGLGGLQGFDSLAVDGEGHVCVATLASGQVSRISPEGEVEQFSTADPFTTNICFGGDDLRTAFLTLSGTGRLVSMDWPVSGHRLAHVA